MNCSPVHNFFEFELHSQFQQPGVSQHGIPDPRLHSVTGLSGIQSTVTIVVSPVSHLLLLLARHPHLQQAVGGAGQALEQARQRVRAAAAQLTPETEKLVGNR